MEYLKTSSGHWLEIGGQIVPSLTTMIQGGSPKPPWILKWVINHCVSNNLSYEAYVKGEQSEALRVGAMVHSSVEKLYEGEELEINNDPEVQKALTSFLMWHHEHKPKIISIEERLFCEDIDKKTGNLVYPFCGTTDIVYEDRDGKVVLADFKTSKTLDETMGIQLSGYKQLWDATHDRKIDKIAIIQLKKNFVGSSPRANTNFYFEYQFDPESVYCTWYLFNLNNRDKNGIVKPTYKPDLRTVFNLEEDNEQG